MDHLNQLRVLGKDGSGGSTVKILCIMIIVISYCKMTTRRICTGKSYTVAWIGSVVAFDLPSLILATPGCWAWLEIGALLAGVFCGVLYRGINSQ